MENNNEDKEIDLIALLKFCGNKFSSLFHFFGKVAVWVLRFLYRKRIQFGVAIVLALAFSLFWSRPGHRQYRVEAEVRINVMDAFYFHNLINNLDLFCKNNDKQGLCNQLHIDCDESDKLLRASSFFYVDKLKDGTPDEVCYDDNYVPDSTKTQMEDRLLIRLVVSDTTDMAILQQGLLYYFNHNPMIERMNQERVAQLDSRIGNLTQETVLLDSLRRNEYFNHRTPEMKLSGSLFLTEKDKQLYHGELLDLEAKKSQSQYEKVVNSNSVNFVSGFILVKILNNFVFTFAVSLVMALFLCFVISLVHDKHKQIIAFLEKED